MLKRWARETPSGIAIVGAITAFFIGLPGVIGFAVLLCGDARGVYGVALSLVLLVIFIHVVPDD